MESGLSTPRRAHKFFDSYPQYQRRPADLNARNSARDSHPSSPSIGIPTPPSIDDACLVLHPIQPPLSNLQVPQNNVVWSAHYGYVYCMAFSPSLREGSDDSLPLDNGELRLVTGSGDATVDTDEDENAVEDDLPMSLQRVRTKRMEGRELERMRRRSSAVDPKGKGVFRVAKT